jgi:hypothetical protein
MNLLQLAVHLVHPVDGERRCGFAWYALECGLAPQVCARVWAHAAVAGVVEPR